MKHVLLKKLSERSGCIGIIGLGYVGLPLAIRFCEEQFKVIGFDNDQVKVDLLQTGRSYIQHIPEGKIKVACAGGFEATTDFARIASVDAVIICVPTPLNKYREPDLSFVLDTVHTILPFLRRGQAVSLESTTYPGTTEEELAPRIEGAGLKVGEDLFLIYSPEREDPGNLYFETKSICEP